MIILNHVNHSHILCIVVRVFEFDNCSVKKGTLVNTEMKLYLLLLLLPIAKSNIVLDFEGDNDSIAKLKVDLKKSWLRCQMSQRKVAWIPRARTTNAGSRTFQA